MIAWNSPNHKMHDINNNTQQYSESIHIGSYRVTATLYFYHLLFPVLLMPLILFLIFLVNQALSLLTEVAHLGGRVERVDAARHFTHLGGC